MKIFFNLSISVLYDYFLLSLIFNCNGFLVYNNRYWTTPKINLTFLGIFFHQIYIYIFWRIKSLVKKLALTALVMDWGSDQVSFVTIIVNYFYTICTPEYFTFLF